MSLHLDLIPLPCVQSMTYSRHYVLPELLLFSLLISCRKSMTYVIAFCFSMTVISLPMVVLRILGVYVAMLFIISELARQWLSVFTVR